MGAEIPSSDMSFDSPPSERPEGPFKLLFDKDLDYTAARVYGWRSEKSGLQVILVQKETPIVSGNFSVVSEISNDSGAPHTLEHLVFMGSKKYPYKGLLDQAGNMLFSYTNAWTDTDETVYTLSSAGWEGFRELLPVYLDHVLFPTLTDPACLTEVYHVDGEGEEKGVVFSEMQGVENTSSSIVTLRSRQLLFSQSSGYSSETGGLMANLRVLTNQGIAQFHHDRYRPDNLAVIVSGPVDPNDLVEVMTEFDKSLPSAASSAAHPRPFVDSEPDQRLKESIEETIEFADIDESMGELQISWLGPRNVQDHVETLAIEMLGYYLSREGLGKLQLEMVEVPDPVAVEVSFYSCDFYHTVPNFYLYGIPTDRLEEAAKTTLSLIANQVTTFDNDAMQDCLNRQKQSIQHQIERDASNLVSSLNQAFKYGARDGKDFDSQVSLDDFDVLQNWTPDQWKQFIDDQFVKNPHVTVLARPSKKLYKKQLQEKGDRVKANRKRYGEEGLKKLDRELKQAIEKNDAPIPDEVMKSFKIPDPANIKFINTESATTRSAPNKGGSAANPDSIQHLVDSDEPAGWPLKIQFENFDSQFVGIRLMAATSGIDEQLLPYVEVIFSELFALPMVLNDGTEVPFEDVLREVKTDTIQNKVSSDGLFEEYITFRLKSSFENYGKAIDWIRRAMHRTVFDRKRLTVIVDKHLNSLPEIKRGGSDVLVSMISSTLFSPRSFRRAADTLVTEEFFRDVSEKLESDDGYEQVKRDLEKVRSQLFVQQNFTILVYGNIRKLQSPVGQWQGLVSNSASNEPLKVQHTHELRTKEGLALSKLAQITPIPATESSYVAVIGSGPTNYEDPDIPALAICLEYLQAVEGPFWRAIRGTGLAYGANIDRATERGQIAFHIYRGSDAVRAIKVAGDLVESYATGKTVFEEDMVKGAVSALVHSFANSESNGYDSAIHKFLAVVLKQLPASYRTKFMSQVGKVTFDDLKNVMVKYILPIFRPESSMVFATCNPSMAPALEAHLSSIGYEVTVNSTIEDDGDSSESEDVSGSEIEVDSEGEGESD